MEDQRRGEPYSPEERSEAFMFISEAIVMEIREHSFDCVGDMPAYGTPLAAVVEKYPWGAFLEAAVLAGHLPHMEGIGLAARAYVGWVHTQIDEAAERGVLGDAIGWTEQATFFTELAALLETAAARIEGRRAELLNEADTGASAS